MIKSIQITNIRGIAKGHLNDLTKLNVIVGPNNSGKSTVLDSLFLGAHPNPAQALGEIIHRRKLNNPSQWFLRKTKGVEILDGHILIQTESQLPREVTIHAVQHAGQDWQLIVSSAFIGLANNLNILQSSIPGGKKIFLAPPLTDVPTIKIIDPRNPHLPLHELYSRAVQLGFRSEVKGIIKDLLPTVEDIEILTERQQPILNLVFSHIAHPVELAGDGIQHLLRIALELAISQGGVVLLEEPESHLHPAAISQSVAAMQAAIKRGIQLILTTHSLDLIDIVLAKFPKDQLDDLAFYRVQLDKNNLDVIRFSGTESALGRKEIEADLR